MKKFLIILTSALMTFGLFFGVSCSNTDKNDKPNSSQEEVTDPSDANDGDKNQDGNHDGTGGNDDKDNPAADDDKKDDDQKDDDTDTKGDVDLGGRDENETPRVPLK